MADIRSGDGAGGAYLQGRALRRRAALSAAGAFLDGYDLLIINAALLTLVPQFGLSGARTGMLTSLPFIGMVIGALAAGRLCDLFGRRRIYMIDVGCFLVITLLLAGAQEFWQLVILRFLLGVAIGMDMPTGTSMLAEFSPPKLLGRLTSLMQTVWVFGGMVAAIVGYILHELFGASSWRWMFASAAIPALIIAIARHSLPETPRWKAARSTVVPTAGLPGRRSGIAEILRTPAFRSAVGFFTVYWVVESFLGGPPFVYTALIFNKVLHFEASQALLLNAGLSFVYVLANVFAQFVILDRFGRKRLAAVVCTIAALGAIATGILGHTTVALVVAFGVFAVATQVAPVPFWPWSVEQLPTRIRATGQSIGSAGGKLGQFIGLNIFTTATIAGIGWTTYFVGVGVAFALLVVFVIVVGKETRGADLDALDAIDNSSPTRKEV
ncbi:MFS transporter [Microlunatus soli]|uniref:MFS transporter, putative metabolite transport protein n=1 Tax=Microlunatus soli TaxID=630515 RepID=A0A1H1TUM7_9ACTN|nr:MFS transporter [Microlunatus soli]SDS63801.1 MFS transporter, putative metabolite transport protein [Microlunatus soli]